MKPSFDEPDYWCLSSNSPLSIPSEKNYQHYLIGWHYQKLEYQHFLTRLSTQRTAKIQWFTTDIAVA
ncbi:hypothetical protein [Larkinella ripae]